jgi:hypothetical protein
VSGLDAILGSYTFECALLPFWLGIPVAGSDQSENEGPMSGPKSFDDHGMISDMASVYLASAECQKQQASYVNHRFTRWKRQRQRDDSLGSCSS